MARTSEPVTPPAERARHPFEGAVVAADRACRRIDTVDVHQRQGEMARARVERPLEQAEHRERASPERPPRMRAADGTRQRQDRWPQADDAGVEHRVGRAEKRRMGAGGDELCGKKKSNGRRSSAANRSSAGASTSETPPSHRPGNHNASIPADPRSKGGRSISIALRAPRVTVPDTPRRLRSSKRCRRRACCPRGRCGGLVGRPINDHAGLPKWRFERWPVRLDSACSERSRAKRAFLLRRELALGKRLAGC